MRTRASFKFVPAALLVAVVVFAFIARTRSRSNRASPLAPVVVAIDAGPAPLRGPSPPPAALVPSAPTRMLHGGAHRTHRAPARGPRSVKVGYRVSVGGPIATQVTTSPDESVLYVASLAGSLTALARSDGSKRFEVSLGDRGYSSPLVREDGTIWVGSDAKKFFSVGADGQVRFRIEVEGEADTAAAEGPDGTVIFAAGSRVYSARSRGDVAWRFGARGKIFTAPAMTDDGLVIVGSQDHFVYAISPSGALAWKVDLGADVDGAAAIADDGSIYVGTDGAEVVKLDGKGTVVWRTATSGFVRGALSIARNGDVLAGTYGPTPRLLRIGPDGRIRGEFAIRGTGAREFGIHGGPLEDQDGVLYFGTQDNAVRAVGPDGAQRWRFETGGDVDAPLTLLSDGSLIVASEDGTVTLLLP